MLHISAHFQHLQPWVQSLPELFRSGEGELLYQGRNALRIFRIADEEFVVKSFARPNLLNRYAYGVLRGSKAQRSYERAGQLLALGFHTPEPVAWLTLRHCGQMAESYYVSRRSTCPFTFLNLLEGRCSEPVTPLILGVFSLAARLHEAGLIHRDFSRGNLLFDPARGTKEEPYIEIIDLNRIRQRRVSVVEGLHNFSRLALTDEQVRIGSARYAAIRHASPERCHEMLRRFAPRPEDWGF